MKEKLKKYHAELVALLVLVLFTFAAAFYSWLFNAPMADFVAGGALGLGLYHVVVQHGKK